MTAALYSKIWSVEHVQATSPLMQGSKSADCAWGKLSTMSCQRRIAYTAAGLLFSEVRLHEAAAMPSETTAASSLLFTAGDNIFFSLRLILVRVAFNTKDALFLKTHSWGFWSPIPCHWRHGVGPPHASVTGGANLVEMTHSPPPRGGCLKSSTPRASRKGCAGWWSIYMGFFFSVVLPASVSSDTDIGTRC